MNRIEEMIKEMCPDGVRRVRLGEVCEVINGRAYRQSELLSEGKYKVLRVGNFFSNENWYYSDLELEDKYYCQKGDLLYAWSATFGPHLWKEDKTIYHYHIWKLDVSCCVNKKYLYYWLQSNNMLVQVSSEKHGATMAHLTKGLMENLQIPLPPLPIQQEIVKILDSFTALQQNLEDELKLRQKQYEHYREKLLTFEDGECEWKKLGDIASFKYGFTDKAKDNGDTRYVRITDITNDGHLCTDDAKYVELTEESKPYLLKKDDLVMARTGATFGKTLLYQEDYQSIYASFLIKIVFETNVVVPKYYWIFTKSSRYWLQANKLVGGGAQPQFNANALAEIFVPVPPIETQLQITQTLDHFESLISNLKTEIELRKKQYEYYREKLLTF